jgi:hypothetical protein
MQEPDPCRKLTVLKAAGMHRVRKPKLRWLESVEEDINNAGMRNWRCKCLEQEWGRKIIEEV